MNQAVNQPVYVDDFARPYAESLVDERKRGIAQPPDSDHPLRIGAAVEQRDHSHAVHEEPEVLRQDPDDLALLAVQLEGLPDRRPAAIEELAAEPIGNDDVGRSRIHVGGCEQAAFGGMRTENFEEPAAHHGMRELGARLRALPGERAVNERECR